MDDTRQIPARRLAAVAARAPWIRNAIALLAPEFLRAWAGRNPFKKMIAGPVGKSVARGFSAAPVPEKDIPSGGVAAGAFLTALMRTIAETHRDDPELLARTIEGPFRDLVENTDFGELKEAFDTATPGVTAAMRAINGVLWEYPAKTICLLTTIPPILNILVAALRESIAPVNTMSPDLLADVVLAMLRDVDGGEIGLLVNELAELARKVDTGSALLGETNNPQFPRDLAVFARQVLEKVDGALLLKGREALAQIREQAGSAFIDALDANPPLAREYARGRFRSIAASIKAGNRRAAALERLFTEEEAAGEFTRNAALLDGQLLADTVNRLCAALNAVREQSPDALKTALAQFCDSVDPDLLSDSARAVTGDLTAALEPLAPAIVPPLLRGLAGLVEASSRSNPGETNEALTMLANALAGKEVPR